MADIAGAESKDPRLDFLQDFTLKSLRLKPDKWARMVVSDEQRTFISNFVDRPSPQVIIYVRAAFPGILFFTIVPLCTSKFRSSANDITCTQWLAKKFLYRQGSQECLKNYFKLAQRRLPLSLAQVTYRASRKVNETLCCSQKNCITFPDSCYPVSATLTW